MGAALGLLSLAGGFLLIHFYPRTAIPAYRAQGQRLLLYSASAAVVLLALSRLAILALQKLSPGLLAALSAMARSLAPGVPFAGTLIGSMALAMILAFALRSETLADEVSVRTIYQDGDELEILLWEALHGAEPIEVTLETGKVYIGLPVDTTYPREPRRYVRILPYVSGFRDSRQEFHLTVQYLDLLETAEGRESREVELVIPVDRIVSARMFDLDLPSEIFRPPVLDPTLRYSTIGDSSDYPISRLPS